MTTTTVRFSPDMTLTELRAAGVRECLATVRTPWLAWCRETSQPTLWARWMCRGTEDGGWNVEDVNRIWSDDLRTFITWAQAHRDLFEETTMTATLTAPTYVLPELTELTREQMLQLHDAYFAYRTERGTGGDYQVDWDSITSEDVPQPGQRYSFHLRAMWQWLGEHPEHLPVPPVTAPPVVAIGPEHPGWDAWWDELWEHAEEAGYTEEYNKLAEAMGGPEHSEPELQYAVEVRIDSFYVTVYRSARASDADSSEFSDQIDQSDIDEAVRGYVSSENVNWEVSDYSEV